MGRQVSKGIIAGRVTLLRSTASGTQQMGDTKGRGHLQSPNRLHLHEKSYLRARKTTKTSSWLAHISIIVKLTLSPPDKVKLNKKT